MKYWRNTVNPNQRIKMTSSFSAYGLQRVGGVEHANTKIQAVLCCT